jgi:hypothetical protein
MLYTLANTEAAATDQLEQAERKKSVGGPDVRCQIGQIGELLLLQYTTRTTRNNRNV